MLQTCQSYNRFNSPSWGYYQCDGKILWLVRVNN